MLNARENRKTASRRFCRWIALLVVGGRIFSNSSTLQHDAPHYNGITTLRPNVRQTPVKILARSINGPGGDTELSLRDAGPR